ncbi:MAG: glutamate--tRNA ligase [Firmicutes bacterium]|nr:glutamate--tRNA ligase [Bacillota bacterium]
MDYQKLAELCFPEVTQTPEDLEKIYPPRQLPEGARVTRMAPSPTGFIHLGNLFGALTDERIAHRSEGGICLLRIEDTDEKREVEGAIPLLLEALAYFGITFDEGATADGETGNYGPYTQSHRGDIYKVYVKKLVSEGKAYPCFMSEDEIAEIRQYQTEHGINPGIYGEYARCRDFTLEQVEEHLKNGEKPIFRFRSEGDPEKYFTIVDGIRGEISMPENVQDVVILKKNDLPTYHFAHVVDDHLMRITHIVRGEEWMASLPIHVQLFDALGLEPPVFGHNTVLMKTDEATGQKRKLSKRKDPELSLEFYKKLGYFPEGVREYLMTILNSDYEEWRMANPEADLKDFDFQPSKMSSSGTMFDLNKLNDVCKDVLARKTAEEIYDFMYEWSLQYEPEKHAVIEADKDMLLKVFDIDRGGEKPRKDLVYAGQIFDFVKYFFDGYFEYESPWPAECSPEDCREILRLYIEGYDPADDNSAWFGKVRAIASQLGYAEKPKEYKKNPDMYKGHVGHVSSVIRIAITGRANSPDLWTIQQIMGREMVERRIAAATEQFK